MPPFHSAVVATPVPMPSPALVSTGKREQTKLANRQAILEAARITFGELGYESATVRDIIRRTSLSVGAFYNYFRSKEEIAEAGVVAFVPRDEAER